MKAGDGLEDLLVKSLPQLAKFARRLVGPAGDAGDLVQETCCRVIEARSQFRTGTNALAWFCCILRNIFYDAHRRNRRDLNLAELFLEATVPAPIALWRQVSDEEVALGISSLSPDFETTFRRFAIDGQPYKQIARDLGINQATVGGRVARSRLKVRTFLADRLRARGCVFRDP